ncbi:MAG: PSD1 and planctomycete cytochrome C domain-containing protein [Pirellulales bacterium]
MKPGIRVWALLLCGGALLPALGQEASQPTEEQLAFFETRIRPVLVTHCYECHAADSRILQGGLRVDHRAGLLAGGDSGPAVVPGKPQESLLLKALRYDGLEMPPRGRLTAAVIEDFERWIRLGLPDPRVPTASAPAPAVDLAEGRKHWSFQPVRDVPPPEVADASWSREPLDRYVLRELEQHELRPLGDAARETWLRRVCLDLVGLPPSPEELSQFLADDSPAIRTQVVDRLLASRAFGERWARHWLDLTGYADQVGTSNEVFAEHAWRYRDYVIDAYQRDLPYDRFLIEQLAGDLLPADSPEARARQLVATGFLLVGDVEIVNPDKLKLEADHIDAQLNKIGIAFLGMTLGCARCHDHKFDPIELRDYYALAGTLRSTVSTRKIPNGIWSGLNVVELPETVEQRAAREAQAAAHRQGIQALRTEQQQLNEEQQRIAADLARPGADQAALQRRRDEIQRRLQQLPGLIQHAEFFAPQVPRAFALQDAVAIGDMPILIRGNPYAPGRVVPRGTLRVASWETSASMPRNQSGRLQLAEWLADPRHPLTARVAVNRIWQKLFGEGLVRSVDYFGVRGAAPSHPALLDHLAARFMRDGWSQKQLIRTLVLSRAYGLSSGSDPAALARDPENRLWWRMPSQRLDAEALRDSLLAVSGELLASGGGPSLPLEYLENTGNLAPGAVNPPSFTLRRFRPAQEFQRTIYLPVVRSAQTGPARLRDVFDFTQPAQIAGRRSQTVVATQALYLLNNDLPRRRAAALAALTCSASPETDTRLEQLWWRVFQRSIAPVERAEATEFLTALEGQGEAWVELCHALLTSNEFLHRL